jgi:prepilin-type processing-associated H-X9-DG protein
VTFLRSRGKPVPQMRSYAMNVYLNPVGSFTEFLSRSHQVYRKSSDIRLPSNIFVFQDVNPQNICTPAFIVDMPGAGMDGFFHFPATHHNRSGVMTFADGHVETRRWQDPRTFVKASSGTKVGHDNVSPRNSDLAWIRERTTARK